MSFKNQIGLSILEILMSVAVVIVAALASITAIGNFVHASKYYDDKNNVSTLQGTISNQLRDPATCDQSMGQQSGMANTVVAGGVVQPEVSLSVVLPDLNNGNGLNHVITKGSEISGMQIKVDDLKLKNINQVSTNRFVGDVYLQAAPTSGDSSFAEIFITSILFDATAGGQVKSCQSNTAQVTKKTCEDMGCLFDPAKTPMCQCPFEVPERCPAGQYPTKYGEDKKPVCVNLGGACPQGQYAVSAGIDKIECRPPPPTPCIFVGTPVQNGESITAYQAAKVPNGSTCVAEKRTCTDGFLSGSFGYLSCEVEKPVIDWRWFRTTFPTQGDPIRWGWVRLCNGMDVEGQGCSGSGDWCYYSAYDMGPYAWGVDGSGNPIIWPAAMMTDYMSCMPTINGKPAW